MVSPYTLGASSLNHSKKLAAYAASPLASVKGFPFSQVINFAISSEFSTYSDVSHVFVCLLLYHTIKSYHFLRSFERSRPVFVLNEGNAAAAASIAVCVSSASNSGAVPINLPEAGSIARRVQTRFEQGRKLGHTMDFKGLSRLCLHPFSVDVRHVRLQQRRVIELWHVV
jgi:hypothetical protein